MDIFSRHLLAQLRATELIEEARLTRLASTPPSARRDEGPHGTTPTAVRARLRRLAASRRVDASERVRRAWRVGPAGEGPAVDRP